MKIEPNEILSQMRAMRAKCLDCACYSSMEVDNCPSTACTLYPYRFGKTPKGFKKIKNIEPFLRRIEQGREGIRITREQLEG